MGRSIYRVIEGKKKQNIFGCICEMVAVVFLVSSVFVLWMEELNLNLGACIFGIWFDIFDFEFYSVGSFLENHPIVFVPMVSAIIYIMVLLPTLNRFKNIKWLIVFGEAVFSVALFAGLTVLLKITPAILADTMIHIGGQFNMIFEDTQIFLDASDFVKGIVYVYLLAISLISFVISIIMRSKKVVIFPVMLGVVSVTVIAESGYYPDKRIVWLLIFSELFYLAVYMRKNDILYMSVVIQFVIFFAVTMILGIAGGTYIQHMEDKNDIQYSEIRTKIIETDLTKLANIFHINKADDSYDAGNELLHGKLEECGEKKILNKEIMKVSLKKKPDEDIYLKSFVGAYYSGSDWNEYTGTDYYSNVFKYKDYFDKGVFAYKTLMNRMGVDTQTIHISQKENVEKYFLCPYFINHSLDDVFFYDQFYMGKTSFYENQDKLNKSKFTPVYNKKYDEDPEEASVSYYFFNYENTKDNLGKQKTIKEYSVEYYPVNEVKKACDASGVDYLEMNYDYYSGDYWFFVNEEYTHSFAYQEDDVYSNDIEEEGKLIDKYFAENGFEYTLKPEKYDRNEYNDFAEFFAKTKKGYCVHFATLATLKYINAKIPARYVEGYRLPMEKFVRNKKGEYEIKVTDEMAHAWTEVFDKRYGWIPKEHTLGFDNSINEVPSEQATSEIITTSQSENQSVSETIMPTEPDVTQTNNMTNIQSNNNSSFLRDFFSVIAYFAIGIMVGVLQMILRRIIKKNKMKKADNNTRIRLLYKDIYRICRIKGLECEGKMDSDINDAMIRTFSNEIFEETRWREVIDRGMRATYSKEKMTKDDYRIVNVFLNEFRKNQLEDVGLFKYIIYMVVYVI